MKGLAKAETRCKLGLAWHGKSGESQRAQSKDRRPASNGPPCERPGKVLQRASRPFDADFERATLGGQSVGGKAAQKAAQPAAQQAHVLTRNAPQPSVVTHEKTTVLPGPAAPYEICVRLRAAVQRVWGKFAVIQRCQVHKLAMSRLISRRGIMRNSGDG